MPETNNKECKEYNSLKYKTMIMTGHNIEERETNETSEYQLDCFLLREKETNIKQTWSKLSKTDRLKRINVYIEEIMTQLYELNEDEVQKTKLFIHNLIERKRIVKVNEIDYNIETGKIVNIPIILFNLNTRKFTLNRNLKQVNKKNKSARSSIV